jgi:hypothetical protein
MPLTLVRSIRIHLLWDGHNSSGWPSLPLALMNMRCGYSKQHSPHLRVTSETKAKSWGRGTRWLLKYRTPCTESDQANSVRIRKPTYFHELGRLAAYCSVIERKQSRLLFGWSGLHLLLKLRMDGIISPHTHTHTHTHLHVVGLN